LIANHAISVKRTTKKKKQLFCNKRKKKSVHVTRHAEVAQLSRTVGQGEVGWVKNKLLIDNYFAVEREKEEQEPT